MRVPRSSCSPWPGPAATLLHTCADSRHAVSLRDRFHCRTYATCASMLWREMRARAVGTRAAAALLLLVSAASVAPGLVAADVIFHVPEVLVRHAAGPRPVGTGRPSLTRNSSETKEELAQDQMRYEYYVEHSISTADAKKMATMIKLSDLEETPAPGCGECTKRELEYCETKVMADHCCCEQRFMPEPFPWLPHTCYLGPERCTPLAGNCVLYARLRDCCCLGRLARHWKYILSKSSRMSVSGIALLLLSAVFFTVYL